MEKEIKKYKEEVSKVLDKYLSHKESNRILKDHIKAELGIE